MQPTGTSTYVRNQNIPQFMNKNKLPVIPKYSHYSMDADTLRSNGDRTKITWNLMDQAQSTRHSRSQDATTQIAHTTRHKRETPVKGKQKTRKI